MSGLAGLLAGHRDPGVYRWHAAFHVADVQHTVEQCGTAFGYVDGWTHTTKDEVLEAFAETFSFPDWFGRNLDALRDCLADVPGPRVLLWDGWSPLARSEEQTFDAIMDILAERAGGDDRFSVLLRGEGPDLEVADLDH
ncbi:MAG: barstar family protein [Nocardioidaceae bacterium]|nr:barstar family protein [Nocardioidaceae bacterium]